MLANEQFSMGFQVDFLAPLLSFLDSVILVLAKTKNARLQLVSNAEQTGLFVPYLVGDVM